MPASYNTLNNHQAIPEEQSGYELAPIAAKGFWSIVSPAGVATNLNSLGVQVYGFTGAGMPPIENILTPMGILGGSILQQTVARSRSIVLACIAQRQYLDQVQRIKQSIISIVAPSNSSRTAKAIKLRFQLVDSCGVATGVPLEVPVIYVGDLTGNTANLYQDRFALQFMELVPPSITELTDTNVDLNLVGSVPQTQGVLYRSAPGDGSWTTLSGTNLAPSSLLYDSTGDLWVAAGVNSGPSTRIGNRSGTVNQAVSYVPTPANSAVYTLIQSGYYIYAGGFFTSPQSYIMRYNMNTSSWGTVGSGLNGLVTALVADNDGNIYAGTNLAGGAGGFTTVSGGFAKFNITTNTWSAPGTGLSAGGSITKMVRGKDGWLYIIGSFTSFNGVAAVNMVKYDPASNTTVALITAFSGVALYDLAVMPDGRIVVVGNFTSINSMPIFRCVAIWNGTQWQTLGSAPYNLGLDNRVDCVCVDQSNGDIYLFGSFTGLYTSVGSPPYVITQHAVKFTGSIFLPLALYASGNPQVCALRQSDKELAVGFANSLTAISVDGTLTVNYAGTADVVPQITISGPGSLYSITNFSTKKVIYFSSLVVQDGETLTLTLDPIVGVSLVSNYRGSLLGKIMPGSDVNSFALLPGTNYLNAYMLNKTSNSRVRLTYRNTHWSFDAGA
jgi:hypothetical protein